jgi:uncharacterized protein (DUF1778 family)
MTSESRRPGRPPKTPDTKRTERLQVYATPAEAELIAADARARGQSISAYLLRASVVARCTDAFRGSA